MLTASAKINTGRMGGTSFNQEEAKIDLDRSDMDTNGIGQGTQNWMEIRPQGKNPERRGYHSAFVHHNKLYVYGGRDLSKGAIATMWVADMLPMHRLYQQTTAEVGRSDKSGI